MRSQVEPNGDCVVRARKRGAQKALGALHLAADAHERAQIGERRLRVGVSAQCEAHCQFGFLDGAHSVAGDAKIDIGVGPTRLELGRLAESPRRLLRVPDGEARLAVGVMRRGPLRSAMTSFACRKQSRLGVADGEQGNRAVQVRRVVIREGPLGSSEGANGLVMSTCPLKRDPELQSHWTVRGVDGQRRFPKRGPRPRTGSPEAQPHSPREASPATSGSDCSLSHCAPTLALPGKQRKNMRRAVGVVAEYGRQMAAAA